MKYLICDRQGRDLACLLFGAATWQVRARDQFNERLGSSI
jgi:hypothetical protein